MPSERAKIRDPCLNDVLSNIVTLCSAGAHIYKLIPVGEQLRGMTFQLHIIFQLHIWFVKTNLIYFIVYIE